MGLDRRWIEDLGPQERVRAEKLLLLADAIGMKEPEVQLRSEMVENKPQVVKHLILRRLWSDVIDNYRADYSWIDRFVEQSKRDPGGYFGDAGISLERLVSSGSRLDDLGNVMRFIAYESIFAALAIIDEGYDPNPQLSGLDLPGWALMETDVGGHLTGRRIGELHAEILGLDPSGREGGSA